MRGQERIGAMCRARSEGKNGLGGQVLFCSEFWVWEGLDVCVHGYGKYLESQKVTTRNQIINISMIIELEYRGCKGFN